jgi:hypothetical protein
MDKCCDLHQFKGHDESVVVGSAGNDDISHRGQAFGSIGRMPLDLLMAYPTVLVQVIGDRKDPFKWRTHSGGVPVVEGTVEIPAISFLARPSPRAMCVLQRISVLYQLLPTCTKHRVQVFTGNRSVIREFF